MRVGPSRYRWEFRLLPDETADDFSTVATLYPLIRPWVDGVAPERLQLVRVAEYTFRAQIADRWRRDNIFLLGDAARLTPPFIGQGLCAGIRDAMNLGYRRHHGAPGAHLVVYRVHLRLRRSELNLVENANATALGSLGRGGAPGLARAREVVQTLVSAASWLSAAERDAVSSVLMNQHRGVTMRRDDVALDGIDVETLVDKGVFVSPLTTPRRQPSSNPDPCRGAAQSFVGNAR